MLTLWAAAAPTRSRIFPGFDVATSTGFISASCVPCYLFDVIKVSRAIKVRLTCRGESCREIFFLAARITICELSFEDDDALVHGASNTLTLPERKSPVFMRLSRLYKS